MKVTNLQLRIRKTLWNCVLAAYPFRLRRRFGQELQDTVVWAYSKRKAASRLFAMGWLARAVVDVVLCGLLERFRLRNGAGLKRRSQEEKKTMANLYQDVKFALRTIRKQPLFSLTVVLAIALGIGANTAMFSVVNGVLLSSLPYPEPDRLVIVYENDRVNKTTQEGVSGPDYFDWIERQSVFSQMAAWTSRNPTLTGSDEPARLEATPATRGLFETLGVATQLGRVFTAEEDVPGGNRVVVISYGFWQRRFGGSGEILGRTLQLDGEAYEVIGVMPAQFDFPSPSTDVWVPLQASPTSSSRGNHGLTVVARLKEATRVATASEQMSAIMEQLEKEYPQDNIGRGATVETLETAVVGPVRSALLILMAAVGLVLLIACANVANLLLSRATTRSPEIAIRLAVGAGRGRIISQLVAESLVLSLIGGVLGILIAFGGVRLLLFLQPSGLPRLDDISIDGNVLVFAFALAAVTGLAVGLVPALQTSRTSLVESLNQTGRNAAGGVRQGTRQILATVQIAVAFVLLMGASLLIQSLWNLMQVDPGYQPDRLVSASVNLPASHYPNDFEKWPDVPEVTRFHAAILERLQGHPEVQSVALALNNPAQGGWTTRITIEGGPATVEEGVEEERIRPVTPNYFGTIGTPLRAGRDFSGFDRGDSSAVVIVNQSFADKYYSGENALGKRIQFWGRTREIVGVASDVRFMGVHQSSRPAVYAPFSQLPFSNFDILVRGSRDHRWLLGMIRTQVAELDPTLAVYNESSLQEMLQSSMAPQRFNMILLVCFAALALLLASIGIFGVISYGVSRRMHEFGVRISLGAGKSKLLVSVLRQGFLMGIAGVLVGALAFSVMGTLIGSLLFEVEPLAPVHLLAVAGFLLLVACLSALVPARRASNVDPLVALRWE